MLTDAKKLADVAHISAQLGRLIESVASSRRTQSPHRPVRITPGLRVIAKLAWCLDNESTAAPANTDLSESEDADSLQAVAVFLAFISRALADQVKNMADDEDVPGVWEDQFAIEARLLREQLNLKPVEIGRILARVHERFPRPSQSVEAAAQSEARRKEADRRQSAATRLSRPLIAALTDAIRAGFPGDLPDNSVLDDLVRRTSIAALSDLDSFNEIGEMKSRPGRPRKKRARTS
ncbi:MAG TPA: hypothetical protein VH374_19400 [Polyangia bacterium]|nr:hypothetical protein [Polyangia bacterium]